MQTEQVRRRLEFNNEYSDSNVPISFSVYRIKNEHSSLNSPRDLKKYAKSDLVEVYYDSSYVGQREISKRLSLEPGGYVIMPSLFEKDVAMKFLLRIFIEGEELESTSSSVY